MQKYWMILHASLLLGGAHLSAQDLLETLKQSRAAYQALENYHGRVITESFGEENTDQVIQTTELTIRKAGSKFWYDMGEVEMLLNEDHLININRSERVLTCQGVDPEALAANPLMAALAAMVANFSEICYRGLKSGEQSYVLRDEGGPVPLMELYFDEANKLLNRAVYHYAEGTLVGSSRVEIRCEHLSLNPRFRSDIFRSSRFVNVQGNQVQPIEKYRDYTLILGEGLERVNP